MSTQTATIRNSNRWDTRTLVTMALLDGLLGKRLRRQGAGQPDHRGTHGHPGLHDVPA